MLCRRLTLLGCCTSTSFPSCSVGDKQIPQFLIYTHISHPSKEVEVFNTPQKSLQSLGGALPSRCGVWKCYCLPSKKSVHVTSMGAGHAVLVVCMIYAARDSLPDPLPSYKVHWLAHDTSQTHTHTFTHRRTTSQKVFTRVTLVMK